MKKLIVFTALLLVTTLSLTSCDKKVEPQTEGEPAQTAVDSVPQTEVPADSSATTAPAADTITE